MTTLKVWAGTFLIMAFLVFGVPAIVAGALQVLGVQP